MQGLKTQTAEAQEPRLAARLLYMDNLRWSMIILVVSMHSADTYSPLGNWYFVNRQPLSTAELLFFAAWQTYLQAFFMGLLFFIAGFFVPGSFDRKGAARFLRDRAFRLGWPVLLYMFVIGPVTEYYVAHSWTATHPTSFASEWLKHIKNGQFLQENGPLWFCLALLIFSAVYAMLRARHGGKPPVPPKEGYMPGAGALVRFTLSMAGLTFLIRLGRPAPFLNMPLKDFGQYTLLFGAGIVWARRQWLTKRGLSNGLRPIALAFTIGLAAWLTIIITGGALRGEASAFSGGWHWQNAAFSLWESLTCVALCYGLLTLYQRKYNRQGRVSSFLSRNAFSVYVFHAPILILLARMLQGAPLYPIVKFLLLTILAVTASFALSAAVFRRIPGLREIL